jgi:hypothetical protein
MSTFFEGCIAYKNLKTKLDRSSLLHCLSEMIIEQNKKLKTYQDALGSLSIFMSEIQEVRNKESALLMERIDQLEAKLDKEPRSRFPSPITIPILDLSLDTRSQSQSSILIPILNLDPHPQSQSQSPSSSSISISILSIDRALCGFGNN